MFLDCPAYTDPAGTSRCGLPAEIMARFTMCSTDGPIESATISCPVGHHFSGPIDSLTWDEPTPSRGSRLGGVPCDGGDDLLRLWSAWHQGRR